MNLFFDSLTGATSHFGQNSSEGDILDDDDFVADLPVVEVHRAAVIEGNAGQRAIVFPVTLDRPSAATITFHYEAEDFVWQFDPIEDFEPVDDTFVFDPGEIYGEIEMIANGDEVDEEDEEDFTLSLDSISGATFLGGGSSSGASGVIVDDDDPGPGSVRLVAPPAPVAEGPVDPGVVVYRDGGATGNMSVLVTLVDGGTATEGVDEDFSFSQQEVFFPSGVGGPLPVSLQIHGDLVEEGDETIILEITPGVNGAIIGVPSQITITIHDEGDNPPPVPDAGSDQGPFPEGAEITLNGDGDVNDKRAVLGRVVGEALVGNAASPAGSRRNAVLLLRRPVRRRDDRHLYRRRCMGSDPEGGRRRELRTVGLNVPDADECCPGADDHLARSRPRSRPRCLSDLCDQ